ncbi:MAG: SUMF1/EgtB/PvdO family nonheme iron enzyme [Candidatus Marinimicrobia bacterium]|nr:SUMF1/EgtB/PvdO family nonheme iron enzyme [Candidatus Neomarinimicrobiota bacterium]
MAIKLEKIFRVIPFREERITLTGHWHILAALTGTIVLMYLMSEVFPLKGKVRKFAGWSIIIGSDIAFAMVTLFSLKRLWVTEEVQEPLVKTYMIFAEIGLGILEVTLGAYLLWLLIKLIKNKLVGITLMIGGIFFITSCGEPAPEIHPSEVTMNLNVKSGDWVPVPVGEFLSGFNEHRVDIDYDFEIMKTEVTNAEFAKYLNDATAKGLIYIKENEVWGNYHGDILGGGIDEHGVAGNIGRHEKLVKNQDYQYYNLAGKRARITFVNNQFVVSKGYENFPVVYVSWMGANAFADFYGWRLPLKLEWEKAARWTDGRSYPFGNFELGPDNGPKYGNYHHSGDPFDSFNGLTPIGFYNGQTHGDFETKDSKSKYGCYDMAGNAGEWTGDIVRGSHQRYIMGGTMMEYAFEMRSATENSGVPGFDDDETGYNKPYMSFQVGFRCARGNLGNILERNLHSH